MEKWSSSAETRTINLYCPSLSKLSTIVVPQEDHRIDIGAIARLFGLDPATVKLNGHFISRGVDLVASSVTWNSLLSFFSARCLPTGINGGSCNQSSSFAAALRVDGKLFCKKSRPKRSYDASEEGVDGMQHHDGVDYFQSMNCIMSNKKQRVQESPSSTGCDTGCRETINREEDNVFGFKRKKHQLESSSSPLKRLKEEGGFSKMFSWSSININSGCRGKENSATAAAIELREGAKRARQDDTALALGPTCKGEAAME